MKQESAWSREAEIALAGAALGAAAAYFIDPDRGRRRRALVRDKVRHFQTQAGCAFGIAARDLTNRWKGIRARTRHLFVRSRDIDADPQVVVARLRARLGRIVSNPHSIRIAQQQGRFTLSGPILAHEKAQLLHAARHTPGVNEIEDRLEVHMLPDGVAGLQGTHPRNTVRSELFQENWSPALRAIAILGGVVLGGYGLARRTPASMVLAAGGAMLCTRAIGNQSLIQVADAEAERPVREFSRRTKGVARHDEETARQSYIPTAPATAPTQTVH